MTDRSQGGKQGLWTRIKHQYGSASAALSQLSLSSHEHDGESERDTVVHNALVRFYSAQGNIPPWLGVETNTANMYSQHPGGMLPHSHSSSNIHRNRNTTGGAGTTTSSALQDIYNRRQQAARPSPSPSPGPIPGRGPSPGNMPPAPVRSQSFNVPGTAPERSDRFKNKLRSAGRANW